MRTNILVFLFLLLGYAGFSQITKEYGTKFDYDSREIDSKVVLVDNYNHYMASIINVESGLLRSNQIIIRKFDQKNQLVETFTEEFPNKDLSTIHKYVGSFEIGKEKFIVLVDCYSNKTKKKEIHQITFDKKTGLFDKKVIATYTFESMMKSGYTSAIVSNNKNYIGIVYSKFANKKIAEEYQCTIIDGRTGDLLWQKDVSFPLLSSTEHIVLSDSGKVIFVRTAKETGSQSVLAIADGNTVENKDFVKEDMRIQKLLSFSVGSNEYLIAFNSKTRGINIGEFDKVLVYDVNAATVLKNNPVESFRNIKDLYNVNFNNLSIQNDEINLFVDCDFQSGTKPDPSFPNSSFKVPEYSNGYPSLLVFNTNGELKRTVDYNVKPSREGYKSIGVQNIKGNYFLITQQSGQYQAPAIYRLNNGAIDNNLKIGSLDDYGPIITGFVKYLPEAKRLIYAKKESNKEMVFINLLNIQL